MNIDTLRRMADRAEIQDCLCRYARGVDRGDWDLVRSTYHDDAEDQHGEYSGGIDGLIDWLDQRFAGVDNSMHFLGNSLIEFAAPDFAFVETYFSSRRLRAPLAAERKELQPNDQICREAWGRYADHFERRNGEWRVIKRLVVLESSYTSIAFGGERSRTTAGTWGCRNREDPTYFERRALFARATHM